VCDRPMPNDLSLLHGPPSAEDVSFQGLSIKKLALDGKFEVVNALVINHRWLSRLAIPLRLPCRILGHFRRSSVSGKKLWKSVREGHIKCAVYHSRRMLIEFQPTLHLHNVVQVKVKVKLTTGPQATEITTPNPNLRTIQRLSIAVQLRVS
jgi:hypothetical protein